jgi:hypothetical protein
MGSFGFEAWYGFCLSLLLSTNWRRCLSRTSFSKNPLYALQLSVRSILPVVGIEWFRFSRGQVSSHFGQPDKIGLVLNLGEDLEDWLFKGGVHGFERPFRNRLRLSGLALRPTSVCLDSPFRGAHVVVWLLLGLQSVLLDLNMLFYPGHEVSHVGVWFLCQGLPYLASNGQVEFEFPNSNIFSDESISLYVSQYLAE